MIRIVVSCLKNTLKNAKIKTLIKSSMNVTHKSYSQRIMSMKI